MEHDNTTAADSTHIHVKNMRLILTGISPALNPAAYDELRLETAKQLSLIFHSYSESVKCTGDSNDL